MGKRKKSDSKSNFKECIDPRFAGLFGSKTVSENGDMSKPESLGNVSEVRQKKNENGFQIFIASKIAEYLDKNIKEVDRPLVENDFFKKRLETTRLFIDSDSITELDCVSVIQSKPKAKKLKTDRSQKELLKEAMVTYDCIQRQAEILNS